jgi:hypothetical protein
MPLVLLLHTVGVPTGREEGEGRKEREREGRKEGEGKKEGGERRKEGRKEGEGRKERRNKGTTVSRSRTSRQGHQGYQGWKEGRRSKIARRVSRKEGQQGRKERMKEAIQKGRTAERNKGKGQRKEHGKKKRCNVRGPHHTTPCAAPSTVMVVEGRKEGW